MTLFLHLFTYTVLVRCFWLTVLFSYCMLIVGFRNCTRIQHTSINAIQLFLFSASNTNCINSSNAHRANHTILHHILYTVYAVHGLCVWRLVLFRDDCAVSAINNTQSRTHQARKSVGLIFFIRQKTRPLQKNMSRRRVSLFAKHWILYTCFILSQLNCCSMGLALSWSVVISSTYQAVSLRSQCFRWTVVFWKYPFAASNYKHCTEDSITHYRRTTESIQTLKPNETTSTKNKSFSVISFIMPTYNEREWDISSTYALTHTIIRIARPW